MAVRVYDNGSLYSISVGQQEISAFRRRWPGSGLFDLRSLWAQFDKRNGDLVDTKANGRYSTERFDGPALLALIDDMRVYADVKLGVDSGRGAGRTDWREYLGSPKPPAKPRAVGPKRAPRPRTRSAATTPRAVRGSTSRGTVRRGQR